MTTDPDIQRLTRLFGQGAFAEVAGEARALLRTESGSLVLREILAAALMAQGRPAEAEIEYRAALKIDPSHAPSHYNLGCALLELAADDAAASAFRRALALDPHYAKAQERLAALRLKAGAISPAIEQFQSALAIDPQLAPAHDGLGLALQRLGKVENAADCHRRAIALDPQSAPFHNNLGVALQSDGRDDGALACFNRALELSPALYEAHNNIAVSLEALGRFDEARAQLRLALEARPHYAEAHRNLARLTKYRQGDAHIDAMMRAAVEPSLDVEDRARLGFAIAKALIDIGEDDAAFDFIAEANRQKRGLISYDADEDAALFAKIKATFTPENLEKFGGKGCADDAPIFIVGMPRSGTSLVEQILASHPLVDGAGELDILNDGMVPFRPSKRSERPPLLEGADFRALGEQYVRNVRARGVVKPRFTDKAPLNFRWIGAIRLSLPNAKIVHCIRDPRDVGFSLYRNYFAAGGVRFAYDLAEIGRFYNLYRDLTAYWKSVAGDAIYDLDYERLAGDQEGETRRLLDFCGLDFAPACLAFEKTERPVRTASAAQVREPMNDGSIGMWRRFEARLQPLLETIEI